MPERNIAKNKPKQHKSMAKDTRIDNPGGEDKRRHRARKKVRRRIKGPLSFEDAKIHVFGTYRDVLEKLAKDGPSGEHPTLKI
jgi:hypothetical protein